MDNLAHSEERIVRFIDINKHRPGNWQYVDVDRLEAAIREDETRKWVNLRRRERARAKAIKRAKRDVALATLVFKVVGSAIIFLGYSATMWTHEAGPIIALGFVGALLIFGPSSNKERSINKLYNEYLEDERNDI